MIEQNIPNPDNEKRLSYDLSQTYAKIVDLHICDMVEARMICKYHDYFKACKNLYIVIRHKFGKGEIDEKEYEDMLKEISQLARQYPNVWTNASNEPRATYEIEKSINKLEVFLWEKMEDCNMFGTSFDEDGL